MSSLHPGLTGLQNLENTCYMNAVLQCLCSLTPLVQYFLSGRWNTALHEEIGESATAFGCLVSDMWLGEFDYVSPEAFHSIFMKRYPAFSRTTQHDAQEFLICVLDDLHEAFKEPSQERASPAAGASTRSLRGTSIITQLFEGQLSYAIRCLTCRALSDRPESFTILSLPIPSTRVCSLQDCLECFFQPDVLTRNNQIHCYWCGGNQDATVKASITKAPQIIIFHLKRYSLSGDLFESTCPALGQNGLKPSVPSFPSAYIKQLPVPSFAGKQTEQDSGFTRLCCLLQNHAGDLDYGHYTAFCKHSVTKHWYSFDDAQVTKIPDSAVQADTAYLLFYISQGY
ncbi:ubiquitin carboxyl-terminal hydrolase 50 [Sylvia borin]